MGLPVEEANSVTRKKIVCEGISKTFIQKGTQRVPALDRIDLEVEENEFVVILGPGQSGKSTLLRIIAGLEEPTTGRVLAGRRGGEGAGAGPGACLSTIHALSLENGHGQRRDGAEAPGRREKRSGANWPVIIFIWWGWTGLKTPTRTS